MTKHYLDKVRDGNSKGWLKVKLTSGNEVSLPYGISVEKINASIQNETFRVIEGIYQGAVFVIPFFKERESYFSLYLKPTAIDLVLNKSKKLLLVNSETFPIVFDDSIKIGKYYIYLPDYPHKTISEGKYQDETRGGSRFASTWFKFISEDESLFQSSSYLHFGTYSKGCITYPYFQDGRVSNWNNLVLSLSMSRLRQGICSAIQIV